MGALSSTSSSFGNAAASTRLDNQPNGALFIDDTLKQQALAEEEAAMNQYKVWHGNPPIQPRWKPYQNLDWIKSGGGPMVERLLLNEEVHVSNPACTEYFNF